MKFRDLEEVYEISGEIHKCAEIVRKSMNSKKKADEFAKEHQGYINLKEECEISTQINGYGIQVAVWKL